MNDHKETVLTNTIRALPSYEPPIEVWEQIEVALSERVMQAAVKVLPVHEPPVWVWQKIEKQLYPLYSLKRVLAVAASILLIIGFGGWYFWQQHNTQVKIAYHIETIESKDFEADWSMDQGAFNAAKAKFAQYNFLESQKEYKVLVEELAELETAKVTLEAALQRYGSQPHLIQQMKTITMRQSAVLKKMVTFI